MVTEAHWTHPNKTQAVKSTMNMSERGQVGEEKHLTFCVSASTPARPLYVVVTLEENLLYLEGFACSIWDLPTIALTPSSTLESLYMEWFFFVFGGVISYFWINWSSLWWSTEIYQINLFLGTDLQSGKVEWENPPENNLQDLRLETVKSTSVWKRLDCVHTWNVTLHSTTFYCVWLMQVSWDTFCHYPIRLL